MSSWGTGIKQSDEFLDVYEEFFDKYVDGTDPLAIFSEIWQDYREEFPDGNDDPILHTVRFALAQCLWECGSKDENLWNEINEIITGGKDLKFWGELGADESLNRKRKKSLEEFWEKKNSTPKRIRNPKKKSVPRAPTLHKGEIFAYKDPNGGYRTAIVFEMLGDAFLFAVCDSAFSVIPKENDVWNSITSVVFWASQRAAVPKKDRIPIAHKEITANYNGKAGFINTVDYPADGFMANERVYGVSSWGDRQYFFGSDEASNCMKRNRIGTYVMKELLNPLNLPGYFK